MKSRPSSFDESLKMAPISLKKGEIDNLAEDLILSVAGLQHGTDNFKIALRYVISNFRFNRFLDVNSFDVTRKIDGIREKFLVHCKEGSASQLKDLKEKYLGQPFSFSLFESRTETHYGVLSVLLNLSESPVKAVDFSPKPKTQPVEEEHIDWTHYLLDGEEELSLGIDISEEQREALEEYDEDDKNETDIKLHARSIDSETEAVGSQSSSMQFRDSGMFQDYEYAEKEGSLQRLQMQYWQGDSYHARVTDAGQETSNLLVPLEEKRRAQLVTENIVVRETLWMLQGVATTYIYRYINGRYMVRDDVVLSHASQEALYTVAVEFAASGDKMQKLKDFIASVPNFYRQKLRTRRAFGYAINQFLTRTRKELASLEFEIVNKEKPLTIIELKQDLENLLSSIDLVFSVYSDCATVLQTDDIPSNDSALHIIDTLFNTVCRLDGFGCTAARQVSIMIPILLETLRPLLSDLACWVTFGKLPPIGADEFFIYEDKNASKDDSEAWKHRFRIRRSWSDETKLSIPQFLEEMTDKILLTGKSCGILEQAIAGINDQVSSAFEEEFFKKLFIGLGIPWEKSVDEPGVEPSLALISSEFIYAQHGSCKLLMENYILVFQSNFEAFHKNENFASKSHSIRNTIEKEEATLSKNAPCRAPFAHIFKSSLHPMIDARYEQASKALLQLLTVRFGFDDHFNTMKNFFLMEAGDVLNEFYSEIFSKIRANEYWQSTSYLTSAFQDALQLRFPHLANKITVGIRTEPRTIRNSSNVQSVDVIYLQYAMKWPLTIIFDSKAEETYNAVFSFLLQVKRALWSLERLRIKGLLKENTVSDSEELFGAASFARVKRSQPLALLRQKIYILRMKLLHFVQSFHTYIMTRILHSSGLEFKAKLHDAKDFEEILILHQEFLEKVFDRCLLSARVGFAKEAITRILNLSLNLQRQWDFGLLNVKQDDLEKIETEFDKCSHFIQSFLSNLIRRGSFPHLELLSLLLKM